jgi:hypothetical protein
LNRKLRENAEQLRQPHFRNSVAFPFVLRVIGIALIFLAMQYERNETALQERAATWLRRRAGAAPPKMVSTVISAGSQTGAKLPFHSLTARPVSVMAGRFSDASAAVARWRKPKDQG